MTAFLKLIGTDISNSTTAVTQCRSCKLLPDHAKTHWLTTFEKHQRDLVSCRTKIEDAKSQLEAKMEPTEPAATVLATCVQKAKGFRADFTAYTKVRDVYAQALGGKRKGKKTDAEAA